MSIKNNIAVSLVMGSQSDWDTMKLASEILNDFKVSHETKIVSAHAKLFLCKSSKKEGKVIIAGWRAHCQDISSISDLPF